MTFDLQDSTEIDFDEYLAAVEIMEGEVAAWRREGRMSRPWNYILVDPWRYKICDRYPAGIYSRDPRQRSRAYALIERSNQVMHIFSAIMDLVDGRCEEFLMKYDPAIPGCDDPQIVRESHLRNQWEIDRSRAIRAAEPGNRFADRGPLPAP